MSDVATSVAVMDKPDAVTLASLYTEQGLSLAGIGRLYGVHKNQVRRWLLQAGIPTRDGSTATSMALRGKPKGAKAREAVVRNAAKARAGRTAESREKQSVAMRGKVPWNKGQAWTPELRATHMAVRATPEYKKNLSESLRGEKSPNWKGGKTPEEDRRMQRAEWRSRRAECYARDNWTCQDCQVKCDRKARIQAHHVVPRRYGGSDDLSNLITLCVRCHRTREHRFKDAMVA